MFIAAACFKYSTYIYLTLRARAICILLPSGLTSDATNRQASIESAGPPSMIAEFRIMDARTHASKAVTVIDEQYNQPVGWLCCTHLGSFQVFITARWVPGLSGQGIFQFSRIWVPEIPPITYFGNSAPKPITSYIPLSNGHGIHVWDSYTAINSFNIPSTFSLGLSCSFSLHA